MPAKLAYIGNRFCLLTLGLLLGSCTAPTAPGKLIELGGLTMGTSYSVKFHHKNLTNTKQEIQTNIDSILSNTNDQMSTYLSDSSLTKINNRKTTDWQELPPDLLEVIDSALNVGIRTNGAFDITVGPLVNLWGFGPPPDNKNVPSDKEIQQTLEKVGFHHIQLSSKTSSIKKEQPELYLDLSGIAKGYTVDKIAAYLDSVSVENYMIELGGEIKAKGRNEKDGVWRIGIERPTSSQRMPQTIIELKNTGMATSGNYRNYFEKDGVRYSHTINPVTGRPIRHKLVSVTVLHDSVMVADALATAFLVLGEKQGYELAKEDDIAALFIYKAGQKLAERTTGDFERYLPNKP